MASEQGFSHSAASGTPLSVARNLREIAGVVTRDGQRDENVPSDRASTSPPRSPAWAAAASCSRGAGARSTSTRRRSAWSSPVARASCRGRSPAAGASAMRSRRILSPRLGGRLHGFVGAAPRLRSGAEARRSARAAFPRPAPHLGARWRSTMPRSSRSGRGWATPTSIRRCATPHHKSRADDAWLLSHAFRANGDAADEGPRSAA